MTTKVRLGYLDGLARVLIVDDNREWALVVKQTLDALPLFRPVIAEDARHAEEALKAQRYHVCLLEFGMAPPGKDDLFLIRRFCCRTTFAVVTGTSHVELCFAAAASGAAYLLGKTSPAPLTADRLIKVCTESTIRAIMGVTGCASASSELLRHSVGLMMSSPPQFVTHWARRLGVSRTLLKRLCQEEAGGQAQDVLALCRAAAYSYAGHFRSRTYLECPRIPSQQELLKLEQHFAVRREHLAAIMDGSALFASPAALT